MPVLTDVRLAHLRYTTKHFIQDDPRTIILNRQVKVNKPGGGHDFNTVAIAAQEFRFINQDIQSGLATSQDDGTARRFSYVMVGVHDADVDINDVWEEGTKGQNDYKQFKVESIIPNNGWETRAYVSVYAVEPDKG